MFVSPPPSNTLTWPILLSSYFSFSKNTQFIDWSNQTCRSDDIDIKHQPLKVISQPEMSTQILSPPSICLSQFDRIFLLHLSDFCNQVAMSAKSLVQVHMTFKNLSKYSKLYKKLKAQPQWKKRFTRLFQNAGKCGWIAFLHILFVIWPPLTFISLP